MRRATKVATLTAVATMLFSSTAMALPANTVVIGKKAYSVQALFNGVDGIQRALDEADGKLYFNLEGQTNGFQGLFNGQAITQAQKGELGNITYYDAEGNAIEWDSFDVQNEEDPGEEITVVSAAAVNSTTISVTFSDEVTKEFQVSPPLTAGSNTRTITYLEEEYEVTVNYVPPVQVGGAAVEKIEFVDYRNIKVTFNKVVDGASATNPNNYYMEIIDGDSKYRLAAPPTLQDSNQLSKIETTYPGGAAQWWLDDHIVANTENNKTVVTINLPEDARFTNLVDTDLGSYPNPVSSEDAERTLAVELQTSKTGPTTYKYLTKDVSVNVAVRNVKDATGKFTVNTAVKPIRILDEVNPELLAVNKVNSTAPSVSSLSAKGLGENLGNFELFRAGVGHIGEQLQFVYSEPVFDTHDLDKSDLEGKRDVVLYVNGNKVASTSNGNLQDYLTFDMAEDSTYASSKVATLDAEAAVRSVYKEYFATGIDYGFYLVGVTDLAGNIEVSSKHSFNVKFKDKSVTPPFIVKPVVLDIVQVADNVFRVEFNREGAEGKLVIENPDGNGTGTLEVPIPVSSISGDGKFYSYVAVPARDSEPAEAIPQGISQNQLLAYDGQDTIYRTVRANNIVVKNDPVAKDHVYGDNYQQNNKSLVDDIKAPVVLNSSAAIEWAARGSSISFNVKDVIPWVSDGNVPHWVNPIAYTYNEGEMRFENSILPNQEGADTYLPVIVSYIDANGAKHQAAVTNYNLRPYWLPGAENSDINPGSPGNITYTYNFGLGTINLDLSDYPQLLDSEGKLVAGASYTAEFPTGYFTDSPRDTHFTQYYGGSDYNLPGYAFDFSFGGINYDILNVDNGRDDNKYIWWWPIDSGLGFISAKQNVNISVNPKPGPTIPEQYVPQTSKQLITYDEPTKSLRVEFTGTIDVATLKDKNNYMIDGKTLAQWDAELGTNTIIDYVVNNSNPDNVRQYAIFIVPQDSIRHSGDHQFIVKGVAHPEGALMTPVATVVGLRDNYRPVAVEAIVTGDRQIKLAFDEPIQHNVDVAPTADPFAAARNFQVTIGGQPWTVVTAVISVGGPLNNQREVILDLGNVIPAGAQITVTVVPDQNGNIMIIDHSENKNPIKTTTYNVTRP
ncbi:hypothetical protein [Cohnella herbarum]|uniref:Uncharacterized protein n=1 Tax=Cohnella herbarum TaxID=2728023 RepID=A0A7Z2VQQ0_9BACL|nr:hypothetical protein [Cohnella herbarum]QJD87385.1 hypothetical protein HH215_32210 [Cohnella herbarum]